jgi:hypothetical protein
MKPKALAKLAQFPGLFDRERLLAARDLYDFDNVFTAPLHGFRDVDDYWSRGSAKPHLASIRVPALVVNARNDPVHSRGEPAHRGRGRRARHAVAARARRARGLSDGAAAGACARHAGARGELAAVHGGAGGIGCTGGILADGAGVATGRE